MGKRKFYIQFVVSANLILDDQVIDAVDDDWRDQLYNLHTPEQIASHIAYNMLANRAELSGMDGWADQPSKNAEIVCPDWECEQVREYL